MRNIFVKKNILTWGFENYLKNDFFAPFYKETNTFNETINEEKDKYIRKERHYGNFSRAFYVDNVNKDDILAKFENGELKIVLPKLQKTSPSLNRIEIQ